MAKINLDNETWRKSLTIIQNYCQENFSNILKYSTETLDQDHGCPPPINSLQPEHDSESYGTDTVWQGKRVLWCSPANPNVGAPLKKRKKISVACLGTSLWNIVHALKLSGMENEIPISDIELLKKVSLEHKNGFAESFNKLEWSKGYFVDPNMAQGGDVGVIGYGDELPHHWFIVSEEPHIEVDGHKCLNTWAASPSCDGAGYDYWFKQKEKNNKERYWILTRPFT